MLLRLFYKFSFSKIIMYHHLKGKILHYFTLENKKQFFRILFTILLLILAFWFFKHEKQEFYNVKITLSKANIYWVIFGIIITIIYILLQGFMYVYSFATINCKYPFKDAVILFLKRNFISVFLPAGGVSSLAFFSNQVEKKTISRTNVYFASAIYGYIGIVSVILVTIPFLLIMLITKGDTNGILPALGIVFLLVLALLISYKSIKSKGIVFKFIEKRLLQ